MSKVTVCALLLLLGGCARSTANLGFGDGGLDVVTDPSNTGDAGDGQDDGDGKDDDGDDGAPVEDAGQDDDGDDGNATPDAGKDASAPVGCAAGTVTCAQAVSLGEVDSADAASVITRQGMGSAWFAFDAVDSGKDDTSNARIGVKVELQAPAGATYKITVYGDMSPDATDRCVASDVSDETPLLKTAVWGAYGPIDAGKRLLSVHVEHVSGPCDQPWTLTLTGNPCPTGLGLGNDSLGSCP